MGQFPKHEAALSAAIEDIGKKEQPPGSNRGKFVEECQACTWLRGSGWPWCRAAVLKWRKQAGDKPGDLSAGAWDALNRAHKRGEVLAPSQWKQVIPGDEVIWNIGSGHSSLFEKFEYVGGQVLVCTIDGNSGDMVRRCQRPIGLVRGFICWPEHGYDVPDKRPLLSVVGSVYGNRSLVVAGKSISLPRKEKVT